MLKELFQTLLGWLIDIPVCARPELYWVKIVDVVID